MLILLIRAVLVYLLVIAGVRLMGKRQIGELQPAELVITLLISDLATAPLQNIHAPLLQNALVILLLIALELLFSVLSLKSRRFRTLMQGNSVLVIENGTVNQKQMRALRYTLDDLMEALRLKEVFDLREVDYAYVETNGELSVCKHSENYGAALPIPVICDGEIIDREFSVCALTREKLLALLSAQGLRVEDVFLMTYADEKDIQIIRKERRT